MVRIWGERGLRFTLFSSHRKWDRRGVPKSMSTMSLVKPTGGYALSCAGGRVGQRAVRRSMRVGRVRGRRMQLLVAQSTGKRRNDKENISSKRTSCNEKGPDKKGERSRPKGGVEVAGKNLTRRRKTKKSKG